MLCSLFTVHCCSSAACVDRHYVDVIISWCSCDIVMMLMWYDHLFHTIWLVCWCNMINMLMYMFLCWCDVMLTWYDHCADVIWSLYWHDMVIIFHLCNICAMFIQYDHYINGVWSLSDIYKYLSYIVRM